jgi:peptidoglycan/LPS O-acetylase OafA/YrhL
VLGDYVAGRDNNFNLLRFVAAAMVMVTHSFELAGRPTGHDPMVRLLGVPSSFVAVNTFFVISGFLVAGSYLRNRNPITYLCSRFLRIYPGLLVAVAFGALVVGGAFTSLDARAYLSSRQVWEYVCVNSLVIADKIQLRYALPEVFVSNAVAGNVNGSLWTLPYEVWLYIVLLAVGVSGLLGRRRAFNVAVLITAGIATVLRWRFGHIPFLGQDGNVERFAAYFFGGVAMYVNRSAIPMHAGIAGVLAVGAVVSRGTGVFPFALLLFLLYGSLWSAYVPRGMLRGYNRLGDYSYGMYVYAFPMQQSLVASASGIAPARLYLAAFLLTLCCAMLSWHYVERPALKLKIVLADRCFRYSAP